MPKIKVQSFGISLDGYSAGPHQSLENPLGVNGQKVFEWFFPTRTFQSMHVDSFSKNGKQYAYNAKTKEVTADGVRVKSYEDYHKMFKPLERKVSAFMKNFEDEDMQIMFGDHVAVVVNRDGTVTTEEYEHE